VQPRAPTRNGSSDSIDSTLVFTLDPSAKYLNPGPRRAATTSVIQSRRSRLFGGPKKPQKDLSKDSERQDEPPQTAHSTREGLTLERPRSVLSVFNKLRRTKSAGSSLRESPSWPRKLFSRAGSSRKGKVVDEHIPEVPKIPDQLLYATPPAAPQGFDLPSQHASPEPGSIQDLPASPTNTDKPSANIPTGSVYKAAGESTLPIESEHSLPDAFAPSPITYDDPVESTQGEWHEYAPVYAAPTLPGNDKSDDLDLPSSPQLDGQQARTIQSNSHIDQVTSLLDNATISYDPNTSQTSDLDTIATASSLTNSSRVSYSASENFSPYVTSNTTHSGAMSPMHLSQPETPVMSDYEEDISPLRRDLDQPFEIGLSAYHEYEHFHVRQPSRAAPPPPSSTCEHEAGVPAVGGFQGYSLPEIDQGSALTLRKAPSTNFKSNDGGSQDLVQAWNDGSKHRMSALGELVNEMGYLGQLIN